jgi:hypothetical protein
MDLFPIIALIVSAIAVLLQIITLILVAGMRKAKSASDASTEVKAPQSTQQTTYGQQGARGASGDRFEKRDQDFRRHEKRPYNDQRDRSRSSSPSASPAVAPAAASPAAPADPVERSLRDINMRLKNAERDQEFARRKLQENLGNDRPPRGGREGGDRDYRSREGGDRDRGGRSGGDREFRSPAQRDGGDRDRSRRGGRDRNPRRDNWQDRSRSSAPQMEQAPGTSVTNDEPVFENKDAALPIAAPETAVTFQPAPVQPAPVQSQPEPSGGADLTPSDFNADDLQHGRKIIVKRRPLTGEEGGEEGSAAEARSESETSSPAAPAVQANTEPTPSSDVGPEAAEPVQFGRR